MQTSFENAINIFNKTKTSLQEKKVNSIIAILTDMNLDDNSKIASYLYYPFAEGVVSESTILSEFGEDVKSIVVLLKKLVTVNYQNEKTEAENIRKMFFAITKDIRIIMIKLAFVVSKLRNLDNSSSQENTQFADAILELYAPLAARLGLSSYKTELEDGAFKILEPEVYSKIEKEVDEKYNQREQKVEELKSLVKRLMQELNISGTIMGRKKHIYSIYKKLQKHNNLDKIYDLVAVRAIVKTVPDCYALLGRIHSEIVPLQNRFKDYIAIPKSNGYQSLHTTLMFEGVSVEVQIRTEEMHKYAEYGIAAHWLYKEKRTKQDSLDQKLGTIRQKLEMGEIESVDELASSLKVDIYDGEIFVQTPKGKVVHMPAGSTPIDFAYNIHSEIGNKCVGAKVNGKMVPTTFTLSNGDIVEIVTNPNSKGPSRDWLKFVKTSEAKNKINQFFKKEMKEDNIKLGKTMLEESIKDKGYAVNKLTDKKYLAVAIERYNFSAVEELYSSIGYGSLSPKVIANKIIQFYQKEQRERQEKYVSSEAENITFSAPSDKLINIKGLNNIMVKFAGCCHPMEGDDIVGFISQGRGIIIHRKCCSNLSYFDKDRLIDANWKNTK